FLIIQNCILFFGGYNSVKRQLTNCIFIYNIDNNIWYQSDIILPTNLCNCFGILDKDQQFIYILGGFNGIAKSNINIKIKINNIELIPNIPIQKQLSITKSSIPSSFTITLTPSK
ncbi:hypothetical protein RFI_36834, partial [Reticulomyxa filosa]